eukprot:CAMPEP_0114499780 /NCGR_PEP_ID=MMETSP0109-20121206/7606_1 /TAXON_ID=29199 /ORGANISM="Chlorarachnion reptans, Strain CCCM449" /LENGTH=362 /DNA_ID=CAMNT_0001677383 /DNA_START=725 /DNA_END=1810 /DNA_ORIENTATION=+
MPPRKTSSLSSSDSVMSLLPPSYNAKERAFRDGVMVISGVLLGLAGALLAGYGSSRSIENQPIQYTHDQPIMDIADSAPLPRNLGSIPTTNLAMRTIEEPEMLNFYLNRARKFHQDVFPHVSNGRDCDYINFDDYLAAGAQISGLGKGEHASVSNGFVLKEICKSMSSDMAEIPGYISSFRNTVDYSVAWGLTDNMNDTAIMTIVPITFTASYNGEGKIKEGAWHWPRNFYSKHIESPSSALSMYVPGGDDAPKSLAESVFLKWLQLLLSRKCDLYRKTMADSFTFVKAYGGKGGKTMEYSKDHANSTAYCRSMQRANIAEGFLPLSMVTAGSTALVSGYYGLGSLDAKSGSRCSIIAPTTW